MLPNHAPLVIAEQFGTLESLYPGRIDLGLGRAPGTDQLTLRALRRDPTTPTQFPQDVLELQALLGDPQPGQTVRARCPAPASHVPLWILGSSLFGAQLAAALGLPYAFASHFAPDALLPALEIYRARFQPSAQLAGALRDGRRQRRRRRRPTTRRGGCSPRCSRRSRTASAAAGASSRRPIDDIEAYWSPAEKAQRLERC